MSPALTLVRRWAVDWLCSHDPSVLTDIVSDDYVLKIGSVVIEGRKAYADAVMGQFEQFPGLVLTVHDVMGNDDRAAVRFTEHGASRVQEGRVAAWGGIAIFRSEGGRLSSTYAEEDYASRRRQLRSGVPDRVESPHPAPWDIAAEPSSREAERVVQAWLRSSPSDLPPGVLIDDQSQGLDPDPFVLTSEPRIDEIFSAGNRVAFHVTQAGEPEGDGRVSTLRLAGMVTVRDGEVVSGRLVRDRLGAERRVVPRGKEGS